MKNLNDGGEAKLYYHDDDGHMKSCHGDVLDESHSHHIDDEIVFVQSVVASVVAQETYREHLDVGFESVTEKILKVHIP